eukprot:3148964-Pyramimonas_sp.AAC.1
MEHRRANGRVTLTARGRRRLFKLSRPSGLGKGRLHPRRRSLSSLAQCMLQRVVPPPPDQPVV